MSLDMALQKDVNTTTDSLGLPVDSAVLFSNHKGVYKKRIEKRQSNFIEKIQFLIPFLWDDEEVLLVTMGHSPMGLVEQFLTGWVIFELKRCFLIFTNKRILHVPLKARAFFLGSRYSYRDSISQILYADCESIKQRGRTLAIKYRSGRREKFYHVGPKEKKKVKSLMATMPLTGGESPMLERTHLCPRCAALLEAGEFTCPTCELAFKSRKQSRKLSMVWPGGGYFYTRHPLLGAGDAAAELLIIIGLSAAIMKTVYGTVGGLDRLIFLGVALTAEKMGTIYHANHFVKEFIPEDRNVRPCIESPEPKE